ncbi:hypothetical protein NQ318_003421 [Aromia moschata]|uniref:Uncharacterized protein n=1 Tax=Aromia moschata TaxID=1265417 RepID=A0AAV8YWU1_9CUCU|nr:hypothetical protein NQ318_003421 [Aromia moschata]
MPGLKPNVTEESDDDVVVGNQTMVQCTDEGTLVPSKDGTFVPTSASGTLVELESELGTMDMTQGPRKQLKSTGRCSWTTSTKKEAEIKQGNGMTSPQTLDGPDVTTEEQQRFQSHFQLQLNQAPPQQAQPQEQKPQYHKPFSDGDFEFLKYLSYAGVTAEDEHFGL